MVDQLLNVLRTSSRHGFLGSEERASIEWMEVEAFILGLE